MKLRKGIYQMHNTLIAAAALAAGIVATPANAQLARPSNYQAQDSDSNTVSHPVLFSSYCENTKDNFTFLNIRPQSGGMITDGVYDVGCNVMNDTQQSRMNRITVTLTDVPAGTTEFKTLRFNKPTKRFTQATAVIAGYTSNDTSAPYSAKAVRYHDSSDSVIGNYNPPQNGFKGGFAGAARPQQPAFDPQHDPACYAAMSNASVSGAGASASSGPWTKTGDGRCFRNF